jgi:hypothetical protein
VRASPRQTAVPSSLVSSSTTVISARCYCRPWASCGIQPTTQPKQVCCRASLVSDLAWSVGRDIQRHITLQHQLGGNTNDTVAQLHPFPCNACLGSQEIIFEGHRLSHRFPSASKEFQRNTLASSSFRLSPLDHDHPSHTEELSTFNVDPSFTMPRPKLALVCGFIGQAAAVIVAEGSPCSTNCGNVLTSTSPDDIECDQGSYAASDAGRLYQSCLTCEFTSGYASPTQESDQQLMLYNLRYATSSCLFNFPKHENSYSGQCTTSEACEKFQDALGYRNLSSEYSSYEYCDVWPTGDTEHLDNCRECLQSAEEQYLANFIEILQAGCEQQPRAGVLVSFEGNPFSTDDVRITAPSPTATVNPDWFDDGPLNLEAKVGIAAAGFAILLSVLGCCIIWRGKRKRRAFLRSIEHKYSGQPARTKAWPMSMHLKTHEMNQTPLSQKPLRSWDESPVTAPSETFPRYFSPYSSTFNSPVSATDAPMPNWPVIGPTSPSQNAPGTSIGVALGGDDRSSSDKASSKGKEPEESYEMQDVETRHGYGPVQPTFPQHRQFAPAQPSQSQYYDFAQQWQDHGNQGGSHPQFYGSRAM